MPDHPLDTMPFLERLVRVETKLDLALTGHAREIGDVNQDVTEMERRVETKLAVFDSRLGRVERWMWLATGIAAAAGAGAGSAAARFFGLGG